MSTAYQFTLSPEQEKIYSEGIAHCALEITSEYTNNGGFFLPYSYVLVEKIRSKYGNLTVGLSKQFGYLLFFDNEIQITERDFVYYHNMFLGLAGFKSRDDTKILVVGDGDGGFTLSPYTARIDYVERDLEIMRIGAKYFGAEWGRVNVYHTDLEFFLKDNPEKLKEYDVVLMCITDDFMRENQSLLIKVIQGMKSKAKILCPVACKWAQDYTNLHEQYVKNIVPLLSKPTFQDFYVPGFLSHFEVLSGLIP